MSSFPFNDWHPRPKKAHVVKVTTAWPFSSHLADEGKRLPLETP
jgi:hypothetical protein